VSLVKSVYESNEHALI